MERRKCRGCGAELYFVQDWITGKMVPLDAKAPVWRIEQDFEGIERASRCDGYVSHFSTCPKADEFSKQRKHWTANEAQSNI